MSAATSQTASPQPPARAPIGEWFWRFLAVVMLFVVGWVVWIAIQISPPDIVLPAAYEAAAQGRASRNSGRAIGGTGAVAAPGTAAPQDVAGASQAPAAAPAAAPAQAAPVAAPAEPPVNLDKLRLAESIETPIFERTRRAARPAQDLPK